MGWRAIRLGLDRPGLLRTQIRALLQAAAGRELRVMLPMVTDLDEIRQTRALIERELAHLAPPRPRRRRRGSCSARWSRCRRCSSQLDGLVKVVDFISVGSNDLLQFMTASDRGNTRVVEPLRSAVAAVPPGAPRRSCARPANGERAGDALRRDGRQSARRDGADRPRLPLAVDVGGGDRAGQGDDPGAPDAASSRRSSTSFSTTATAPDGIRAMLTGVRRGGGRSRL